MDFVAFIHFFTVLLVVVVLLGPIPFVCFSFFFVAFLTMLFCVPTHDKLISESFGALPPFSYDCKLASFGHAKWIHMVLSSQHLRHRTSNAKDVSPSVSDESMESDDFFCVKAMMST